MVMPVRSLVLSSAAGSITPNLRSNTTPGFCALKPFPGLGLLSVSTEWDETADDGANFAGATFNPRDVFLRLRINGASEAELLDYLSTLTRILDVRNGPMTLAWTVAGQTWELRNLYRVGEGDAGVGDLAATDMRRRLTLPPLQLRTGSPMWVRATALQKILAPSAETRGMIDGHSLADLRLSSGAVIGSVAIENDGDADAYPVVRVDGPATAYTATSPRGEVIAWAGALTAGHFLLFDHEAKTVVDDLEANVYAELGTVPRFWAIPPGVTTAGFVVTGSASTTRVTLSWKPRRQAVI